MASSEPIARAGARTSSWPATGSTIWIAGDREAAIARFTDDVEVYVPAELGNAGTYRGIEQFIELVPQLGRGLVGVHDVRGLLEPVGESHVVALIRSQGTGTASGIEVANTLGWVLGVRDSSLCYLSIQPDLEAAREHALAREADL